MTGAEGFTVLAVIEARDRASEIYEQCGAVMKKFGGTVEETADTVKGSSDEIDESLLQTASGADALGASAAEAGTALGGYSAEARAAAAATEQVAASGTAAAAGADEIAAGMDKAAASAGVYYDAAGRARLANGQFATSAQLAAAASDKAAVAQEAAGAKSAASAEESAGAMAGMGEKSKLALLGVAGGLAYGIYKAAGFQQQMELLHTQAGVTTTVMNQMGTGVLKLAGQVGQGPDSLAEAAYHVASNMSSMGATTTQMLSAVKVAAEGASVGNANLVDVTNALGAAIASGMKGTQNYTQAMGAMNATVGAGDMKMQDLAEAFGQGNLATVKGYGATLTDVGAVLATFGDNNLRGAAAGTEMRMAVQALAEQASTAKPALTQLGLSAGQIGANMRQHGVVDTLNMLNTRMKAAGLTAQTEGPVITELFGKKAGSGISVLLEQINRVNSKVPELVKGAKNFNAAWAAQQQTPAQKLKDLETGSEALAINLGTALLPAAVKVVGALTSLVNWLEQGSAGAKGAATAIGAVLGLIALKKLEDGLKGAIEGVTSLVKGFKSAASTAQTLIGKLTGLGSAQDKAAAASKKASADSAAAAETAAGREEVAADGALANAEADAAETAGANETAAEASSGSWITAAAKTVGGWAKAGAQMIAGAAKWVADGTVKVASYVAANVAGAVTTMGAWIAANAVMLLGIGLIIAAVVLAVVLIVKYWKQISAAAVAVWHDLVSGAEAAFHAVLSAVETVIGWVKSHWPLLLAILTGPIGLAVLFVVKHFDQIRNGASALIGDLVRFFTGLPGRILSAVSSLAGMLYHAGVNAIKGLISGAASMVGSAVSTVAGWGHDIANALGSPFGIHFSEPSEASQMVKAGRNIPAGLAKGMTAGTGDVAGAAARIAGAVTFGRGGSLTAGIGSSLALSASSAAGGGGGTMTVNIDLRNAVVANDASMNQLAAKVGNQIVRQLASAGYKARLT